MNESQRCRMDKNLKAIFWLVVDQDCLMGDQNLHRPNHLVSTPLHVEVKPMELFQRRTLRKNQQLLCHLRELTSFGLP